MNYYNEIKNELINNEVNKHVKTYSINKTDLNTRYNVGKMLHEAGKRYGEGIIKRYSEKLKVEVDKKYDTSTLNKMKKFYYLIEKMATVSPNLSYSHYVELLPLENSNEIKYYISLTEKYKLSIRELREKIKNKEYERLNENAKLKLINNETTKLEDFVKNPILIKNRDNDEVNSEKALQKLILEDIPSFLKELGGNFAFIENEYKIKIGNSYNYIDFLLFNYEYNAFVVVELKVTNLKKEHIGQIEVYMNYIDNNLRKITQAKTIGIIICRKNNKFIIEYCSDKRIIGREYRITS